MRARTSILGLAIASIGCGTYTAPVPRHPEMPAPPRVAPVIAVIGPEPALSRTADPENPSSPLGAAWGTAHPLSLVAASPDRRWIALCQARADTSGDGRIAVDIGPQGEVRGDRLDGYFLNEPGGGMRIDAFGGADPSGRFVALVVGDRLVLRDTLARQDTSLGEANVDLRDDRGSFLHPRAVSFDPTGRRLLYLRKNGPGDEVVVRELVTGTEVVVSPGAGDLWRADFDATGEWIVLRMVVADSNGNGRLDWPVPQATETSMRCTGPLARYAAWERPGDDVAPRVARAGGGRPVDAPGLVVPFGELLVERDPEGAIVTAKPSGERTTVVKKSCAAKLLHVAPARGLLVVTCENKKGRSDVRFIGRGVDKALGFELLAPAGDHWAAPDARILPLYPGSDSVLVDLRSGDTTRLSPGDRVIATAEDHALILRGRSLVLHATGAPERVLATEVDPLGHVLRSGSVVAVPPSTVDVATGEVLGRIDPRALAIARDGSVLFAEGAAADATHMAVGPLVWDKSGQRDIVSVAPSTAPERSAEPPSVLPMPTPAAK